MKKLFFLPLLFLVLVACSKESSENEPEPKPVPPATENLQVRAVDISSFPEINQAGADFFNANGQKTDFLDILKEAGVNTIRLRLWVEPENEHSGFEEVKAFSGVLRQKGFDIWLSLHFSHTWADPGQQAIPRAWEDLSFEALKEKVNAYTAMVVAEIKPQYVQVGNEINSGFLFPEGNLTANPVQFKQLLEEAISAIRTTAPESKIILHFAGLDNADWFFGQVAGHDYDIIGLSYYPIWHGKDPGRLENVIQSLTEKYKKKFLLAETAYPFTLGYNDWTNNIVGLQEQLVPNYPATEEGQKEFLLKITEILVTCNDALGFSYWGAELVAWKGMESKEASSWENQALFDFNNKALPVLEIFSPH